MTYPIPHDETAERCVLSGILLDNRLMADAAETLEPDDFYIPFHKAVYEAMLKLFTTSEKIDPILVNNVLGSNTENVIRITNLTHGMPHYDHLNQYIRIITDKSKMRKFIDRCSSSINAALAGDDPPDEVISAHEQSIFALSDSGAETLTRIDVIYDEYIAKLEHIAKNGIDTTGIKSGLTALDKLTGGWKPGDLIILAARPSMGKTSAAIQFALHGITEERVGAIFSLEMSKEQLMGRMVANETRSNGTHFERSEGWTKFRGKNLYIDNPPKISPMQILAKSRQLHSRHKRLDLIVIDYLQLLSPSGKVNSRYDAVSEISRELKQVAVELNVPVIALSQLSRAPEARNPPIPKLSDLRESGSIEQDADIVTFIYREDYYKPSEADFCEAEFILAKQRNGPTGNVKAQFWKSRTRFENLTEGW